MQDTRNRVGEPSGQRGLTSARGPDQQHDTVKRQPFEWHLATEYLAGRGCSRDSILLAVVQHDRRPRAPERVVREKASVAQASGVGVWEGATTDGDRLTLSLR